MVFTSDIIKALDVDKGNTTNFICYGEPTTESDYLNNCKYIKGEENNETLYHDTPIYTWKEISDKRVVLENEYKNAQKGLEEATPKAATDPVGFAIALGRLTKVISKFARGDFLRRDIITD